MTTRTHTQTFTTTGAKAPMNMEAMLVCMTTLAVILVDAATATYSVEATLDDVNDASITPRWLTLTDFPVGSTAAKYASFGNPWSFVRINIAAISGTLEFKMLQSFNQV